MEADGDSIMCHHVGQVPPVLQPKVGICESNSHTCFRCNKKIEGELLRCWHCSVRTYCSESCRRRDARAHKKQIKHCRQLKAMHRRFIQTVNDGQSEPVIAVHADWYHENYPNVFNGGNFDEIMGGRFAIDPFSKYYLDVKSDLADLLIRHPSSLHPLEWGLFYLMDVKKATYLVDPYNLDVRMVSVLLKLYREDEVVSLILYWLDWRSRGPYMEDLRDENVQNWKRADPASRSQFPFPITKGARLLQDMAERFQSFPEQHARVSVPIEFAFAVLVIKMRYIIVYRERSRATALFFYIKQKELGLHVPGDQKAHVLSYLIEGGRERYLAELDHIHRLMDYIDGRDRTLLRALVDPRIRHRSNCFQTFLDEFANGEPVIWAIKSFVVSYYRRATI